MHEAQPVRTYTGNHLPREYPAAVLIRFLAMKCLNLPILDSPLVRVPVWRHTSWKHADSAQSHCFKTLAIPVSQHDHQLERSHRGATLVGSMMLASSEEALPLEMQIGPDVEQADATCPFIYGLAVWEVSDRI